MLFVNVKFPIFYFFGCKEVFSREKRNEGLSSVARELSVSWLILCFYNVFKKEKIKIWLLLKGHLDENLKQHCKEAQGKEKLVKSQTTLTFCTTEEEPPKKVKSITEKI